MTKQESETEATDPSVNGTNTTTVAPSNGTSAIDVTEDDNTDTNSTAEGVESNDLSSEVVNGTLVVGNMTFVNGSLVDDFEVDDDLADPGPGLLSTSGSAVGEGMGSVTPERDDLTAANETTTVIPVQDQDVTTNNQTNTVVVQDGEDDDVDEDGPEVSGNGGTDLRMRHLVTRTPSPCFSGLGARIVFVFGLFTSPSAQY